MKKGITIIDAVYVEEYKIKITFSDGKVNIFDYENLVMEEHEEFMQYRNIDKFKTFSIINENTDIAWGDDWHMILPINTLYQKSGIGKAGRKKSNDKKVLIRLYVKASVIEANGGMSSAIEKCYNSLEIK